MKNWMWMVAGLSLLVACDSKPPEEELIQSLRQNLDSQNWEGGIEAGKTLLQHYPKNADGYNMLGVAYLNQEEIYKADSVFSKAIVLDTTNYKYLYNRGNARRAIAMKTREPRDFLIALDDYSKARDLQPNIADIYINRAVMLNQLASPQTALEDLKFAISLDDDNPLAYFQLGLTYSNLSEEDSLAVADEAVAAQFIDSAMTNLEKAHELDENWGSATFWLAMMSIKEGNMDKACELWTKAKEQGIEQADINLHLNCDGYADDHTEEEVEAMIAEATEKAEGEEHFMGDGHMH